MPVECKLRRSKYGQNCCCGSEDYPQSNIVYIQVQAWEASKEEEKVDTKERRGGAARERTRYVGRWSCHRPERLRFQDPHGTRHFNSKGIPVCCLFYSSRKAKRHPHSHHVRANGTSRAYGYYSICRSVDASVIRSKQSIFCIRFEDARG